MRDLRIYSKGGWVRDPRIYSKGGWVRDPRIYSKGGWVRGYGSHRRVSGMNWLQANQKA